MRTVRHLVFVFIFFWWGEAMKKTRDEFRLGSKRIGASGPHIPARGVRHRVHRVLIRVRARTVVRALFLLRQIHRVGFSSPK